MTTAPRFLHHAALARAGGDLARRRPPHRGRAFPPDLRGGPSASARKEGQAREAGRPPETAQREVARQRPCRGRRTRVRRASRLWR